MIFESMVVSDVILDGLVLTIPWYPVWHLNMPLRRKFTVCGIFLLGAFVCLFGIFRVFAMFDAVKPSADRSYSSAAAFYWATIETGIGILSACLPLMRPLIQESGPETLIRSVQQKLKKSLSRTRITSDGVSSRRPSESEYSRAEMISLDNQAKSFDVRKHGYQQGAQ